MYYRVQQSLMLGGYIGLLLSMFGPWPATAPMWFRDTTATVFGLAVIAGVLMAIIAENRYQRAKRKASRR